MRQLTIFDAPASQAAKQAGMDRAAANAVDMLSLARGVARSLASGPTGLRPMTLSSGWCGSATVHMHWTGQCRRVAVSWAGVAVDRGASKVGAGSRACE